MTDKQIETTERDIVDQVEELLANHDRVSAVGPFTRSCKWNDHKSCVREDWCCCVCHDKFEDRAPELLRRMVEEVKRLRKQQEAHAEMIDDYYRSR